MLRILVNVLITAVIVAGCSSPRQAPAPGPDTAHKPALFYSKDGALYVSDPAGAPARKLTDGPADTDPAPSPDGSRLAFVRKASRSDGAGQLWVLDLSTDSVPASAPRRLVDPAALAPNFPGEDPAENTLVRPHWSPSGDRIAFLKSVGGPGFLLTASAVTGAVQVPRQPLFAAERYAWSPDGAQIAWAGGRRDVSPVDVNVLTVGESSTPIVVGTNATSVDFDAERRSVLFANGDATGGDFAAMSFKLPAGGIYATQPPPSPPHPLFSGPGNYDDVATLWRGAVGFTQWSADQRTKSIEVVPSGGAPHKIADTRSDAPGPAWVGDTVAYIGTDADRPLLIATDRDSGQMSPGHDDRHDDRGQIDRGQQIDVGVEAFAWGD